MKKTVTKNAEPHAARYALRRTLPPWCFDERLAELVRLCRRTGVEEVVVKVDTEEFSHGIPTLAWAKAYRPKLAKAAETLRRIGVKLSINPWTTVGHLDRGRDLRKVFPRMEWMVGHLGEECRACACPLSEGWRGHVRELWRMYASVRPNVIWVEDDIRTFNHLPARYGCFCPLHLAAFGRRVDRKVTREEVVAAVLRPGEPHPWRAAWLDLNRDVIHDTCSMLAKTVYEVSPQTRLGLMSSGPENHCLEGRNWRELALALGQGRAIYHRPTLGNYCESSLEGLYYGAGEIKRARFVLPPGSFEQTEVENVPFTGFSKSAAFTFLQIALSVSHGCDGATLNLFDHVGTPVAVDPGMADMLERERPFIETLAAGHKGGEFAGVRILHHEWGSYVRRLEKGADYGALACHDFSWEHGLNACGVTTTYADSPVVAADGQMIAAYGDDEIRRMVSGGILLDLVAAESLIRRGFGERLGFQIERTGGLHAEEAISAEELFDPEFAGGKDKYLTATVPDLITDTRFGRLKRMRGARAISRLVDPDQKKVCDFATIFENSLGGRVAIIPLDLRRAMGPAFLHPYRREQLRAITTWLARGPLPATVSGGTYPLAYRMDFPDRVMLGVFNLSHDDWPEVTWELAWSGPAPVRVEMLAPKGRWKLARALVKASGGRLRIAVPVPLSFRRPMVLRVRR